MPKPLLITIIAIATIIIAFFALNSYIYTEKQAENPVVETPAQPVEPEPIIVEDFEGEADPSVMQLTMKGWVWQYATRRDGEKFVPRNAGAFVLTFADANEGVFSSTTDCNQMGGSYTQSGSTLTLGQMMSTLMFCENSQESDYAAFLSDTAEYQFTSKGELILILKDGLGSMTFR